MYPMAVIVVAFVVLTVIMIFVIPAFEDVFKSFGGELPAPTLFVIALSKFFVSWWWAIFGLLGGGLYFFFESWKRSEKMQIDDGPPPAEDSDLRRPDQQVGHRALDAHAVDDVRRRRAAGRGADSVGGASGNAVYAHGHRADPEGRVHRLRADRRR